MSRPGISQEDNAWPYYEKAIELYVEPSDELIVLEAFRRWREKPAIISLGSISDKEQEEIEKWIEQNKAAWREYAAGSLRPYCYREYTMAQEGGMLLSVLLPHLSPLRDLARVGVWRAAMHAEQGQTQEAFEDCLVVVRAGRHWQGKCTIIEQLVGLTISRLGHEGILYTAAGAELSLSELKHVEQQLVQVYAQGYPLMDIEGERLLFQDIVQQVFTEGGLGGGHLIPHRLMDVEIGGGIGEFDLLLSTAVGMIHARRNETLATFNKGFDNLSRNAKMTPYERHKRDVLDMEDFIVALPKFRYALIHIFMPALDRACNYGYQGRTLHEATVTVLALKRWRLEKGEYPSSLDALVTGGYLAQLPADPYSDKVLVYRKTADSFVLYSLGRNFKDDGGEFTKERKKLQKWGTGEAGDAVFWPVPRPSIDVDADSEPRQPLILQ
jgi:hypothetical protein